MVGSTIRQMFETQSRDVEEYTVTVSPETSAYHPFAEMMKLRIDERSPGRSTCSIEVAPGIHHNPHHVAHGAVLYALADTGMGAALYPALNDGEICVTIEIKITYFRSAPAGIVRCETVLLNHGRTIANLDSRLYLDDTLIAQANGNFAILKRKGHAVAAP
ncbi:PaaI family thioesterase [Bradyrhizobium sp. KBS0727]|jgi:acyl-CoA thioesterase|nr:PaaI family thioesterase [Bradyrhizobium sp. KBS0725]QDW43867.1 PaaI family thioesterase [Bradyrhizobium sp. KBS0727]